METWLSLVVKQSKISGDDGRKMKARFERMHTMMKWVPALAIPTFGTMVRLTRKTAPNSNPS
jgi:hypothetical protein